MQIPKYPAALLKRAKQQWKIVFLLFFVMLAVAGVTYAVGIWRRVLIAPEVRLGSKLTEAPKSQEVNQEPQPEQPFAIAFLGYGGPGHDGGNLTDTMLVAYVQPEYKVVTLISVPRDIWITLPIDAEKGSGTKLNAAYAIGMDDRKYPRKPPEFTGAAGGGQFSQFALEQVLGVPISGFVSLNFSGFQRAIDTLGGVTVQVDRSFTDPWYPIDGKQSDSCGKTEEEIAATTATLSAELAQHEFPCRFETLSFEKGMVTMDGATALKFVRSRHSSQDGNDFGRSTRQRNLLLAIRDKVFKLNFLPKIIPTINALVGDVRTNISVEELQYWLGRAEEFKEYRVTQVALTEKNVLAFGRSSDGQFILQPRTGVEDWPMVHAWMREQLAAATQSAERNEASGSAAIAQ
jgi:anionic cell wall polymer biosynthesis LytR-Cps2A-Psr (LCP) family protein